MTDAEIIKALEYCINYKDGHCENCPYRENEKGIYCVRYLAQNSLDLINRQKAEIERLNKQAEEMKEGNARLYLRFNTAKNKGINEFAERLKEEACGNDLYDRSGYSVKAVTIEDINNVKREMEGEK